MVSLLLVLAACGKPAPPRQPELSNTAPGGTAPAEPASCMFAALVFDKNIGEPALGATVVLSGGGTNEQVEITNERGELTIRAEPDHDTLHVYYNDKTHEQKLPVGPCGVRVRVEM